MNPIDRLANVTSALAEKRPAMMAEYRGLIQMNLAGELSDVETNRLIELATSLGKSAEKVKQDAMGLHNINIVQARLKDATSPEVLKAQEHARFALAEHQEETLQIVRDRASVERKLYAEKEQLDNKVANARDLRQQLDTMLQQNSELLR